MTRVKKEVVEYVCDVCNNIADGEWFLVEDLNGKVENQYICPIDLCQNHMEVFAEKFQEFKQERYETYDEDRKVELINKIKG